MSGARGEERGMIKRTDRRWNWMDRSTSALLFDLMRSPFAIIKWWKNRMKTVLYLINKCCCKLKCIVLCICIYPVYLSIHIPPNTAQLIILQADTETKENLTRLCLLCLIEHIYAYNIILYALCLHAVDGTILLLFPIAFWFSV